MSSRRLFAQASSLSAVLEIHREDRGRQAELKIRLLLGERLHRVDRLTRLVEPRLHLPHLIVDVADAVERHADAQQHVLLGTEFHDARQHRDGPMWCEARRVDADLPHAGQPAMEQLHHFRQIVARRRLAARDVQVFDGSPEIVRHDAVELLQRHVRLAIAHLPVAAHLAAGVADECAVIDEYR